MRVKVRCTIEVEVDIPDEANAHFLIEENGCPATGVVGAALYRLIKNHDDESTCWACAANGKNEIIT